jgi:hypothetical protein
MSNIPNLDDQGSPKPAITTNNLSENANINSFLDKGSNTPISSSPDPLQSINTIQSLIGGNSYVGPNPIDKGYSTPDVRSNTRAEALKSQIEGFRDPLMRSRATSFDGSRFGYNFDRYYNHPKFKSLGFSVYRDNESLYNERSTWLDDWRRMSTQWLGLAGQAMAGTYKGWGRFGDLTDEREAALMENSLSIAQSSKEGLGAWFTNFAANSAYTMGIMGSVMVEELALGAITALSGGASAGVAAARTGINATKLAGSISKLVRSMKGITEAKSVWQGLGKLATGGIKSAANFVNPLRATTEILTDSFKAEKTLNRINEFAKVKKTFGAFYRDMREINLVLSESRLEGGFAKNKVINEATKEFIAKYNRMPNEKESKEIYERAELAGAKTTLRNIPAIYFSNRIVFDTMLKGFKPLNRLMSGNIGKNPFHKVVRNWDWKKGGPGTPFSIGDVGFKFSDLSLKSLKGSFSRLSKEGLPSLSGKLFRYANANLMEGLQESYQEVVQTAYTDYYLRDYYGKLNKDPFLASKNSMDAAFGRAMSGQFSKEGLDVFLSGFLMGGGVQPIQNLVFDKGQLLGQRIFDKKGYEKSKEDYRKNIENQVNALNAVHTDPKKFASWLDQNVKLQKDLSAEFEEAQESGDNKEGRDTQQDSLFHHVHTLLQTQKYDYFIDALNDLKQLDTKDLADAFADLPKGRGRKKQLHERLDAAISKAEFIRDKYDFLQEEYPNPFNPDLIDPKKSPKEYLDEQIAHEAFEEAKKHALFSEYSFNEVSRRMESIVNKAVENNPLGKASATDLGAVYSVPQTKMLLSTMKLEIAALAQGTPEQQAEAKKKQRTYDHLNNLNTLRSDYLKVQFLIGKAATGNQEAIDSLNEVLDSIDTKNLKIYDEEGNKINFKSAKVPVDVKLEAYYRDSLKNVYTAYLKNLAKTQNVYPVLEAINESFDDFLDFTRLSVDLKIHSDNVNTLANPASLIELSQRINRAKKIAEENRETDQEEALETYANYAKNNSLLQDLLDIGVYFDPESFDEFVNDDVIPSTFIDASTNSIITPEDPRYQKIIDLIDKYEQATGKTFSGKPSKPKEKTPAAPPVTAAPPPDDTAGGATTPPPAPATPPAGTSGVDLSTLPVDVKDQLMAAFAKAQADEGATDFEMWVQESPKAQAILKAAAPAKKTPPPAKKKTKADKEPITGDNPKSLDGPDAVTAAIYSNPASLNPDEAGYSALDESGKPIQADRVSNLKKGKIPDSVKNTEKFTFSQERGNVLDSMIRKFASPDRSSKLSLKDNVLNSINSDDEALVNTALKEFVEIAASGITSRTHKDKGNRPYSLELTKGFQKQFADALKELALTLEDYTWNTNLPAIHGVLLNKRYAGSVDVLLEKDGEYYILDIKSSESSRRAQPDIYTDDIVQLNAYADLFEQMTGKPIKGLFIANLIVTSTNEGQSLTKAYWDTIEDTATGGDTLLIPIERKSIAEQFPEESGKAEETKKAPSATAPAMDVVNTPSADIIAELNKLGTFQEKLEFLKNSNLLQPITINGKTVNAIDYGDRVMVLIKIGDVNMPFYISTGQAGKKNVAAGKWYAIFGIGKFPNQDKGWINKGSEEEINQQYKSPILQKIAKILNEGIGSISLQQSNGKIKDGFIYLVDEADQRKQFNDQLNFDTKPETYGETYGDVLKIYTHFLAVLEKINKEVIKVQKRTPEEAPTSSTTPPPVAPATDAKADIERRRQEELFGNLTSLEFETVDTKGRTRKTTIKTKVDENGFKYSFKTTVDGKLSSTAYPKVTKQEFKNSSIYNNLDQDSKDFIDELPEDAVILLQSVAISTDKNSAAGLGNGNITIGYVSKEEGGRVDDIFLKYQPNEINAKYDAEIAALEGEGNLGQIATAPNPELVKRAAKFGFTEDHVKAMSKEERELVATATSKEDVKDLVNKYIKPAPTTPKAKRKNTILKKYQGKIIYVSAGIGKDNLAQTMEFVIDMNDLVIAEIEKRHPELKRNPGESTQQFIYRASKLGTKDKIDISVLNAIKPLLKKGYTVLTSSTLFIKNADVLFTSEPGNKNVITELGGTEQAENFLNVEKERANNSGKKLIATDNIENALTRDEFISGEPAAKAAGTATETKTSKESPTLKAFREINNPKNLLDTIDAYMAMDAETRESLYYILDTDGNQLPLTMEEFTNMAKDKINSLITDEDVKNSAMAELESPFLDIPAPTVLSAEEKENISSEVDKGQTITDANEKDAELLKEVKAKSRKDIRDDFLKGIGCSPKL